MAPTTTPADVSTAIKRTAARFAADPRALARALEEVTFHLPPQNQGQMVEVSYGADCGGLVFRRRYDRSARSVSYEVADAEDCGCAGECGCFEPWNTEPHGYSWVSIETE